jgi:hypothetical protein
MPACHAGVRGFESVLPVKSLQIGDSVVSAGAAGRRESRQATQSPERALGGLAAPRGAKVSADYGHVERVVLSCRFTGIVRDHLDVVRVVTDRADAALDRATARSSADHATKLGIARPARRGDDQLPRDRTPEIENVLAWPRLRRRCNSAGLDDDTAVRRHKRPPCGRARGAGRTRRSRRAACAGWNLASLEIGSQQRTIPHLSSADTVSRKCRDRGDARPT